MEVTKTSRYSRYLAERSSLGYRTWHGSKSLLGAFVALVSTSFIPEVFVRLASIPSECWSFFEVALATVVHTSTQGKLERWRSFPVVVQHRMANISDRLGSAFRDQEVALALCRVSGVAVIYRVDM